MNPEQGATWWPCPSKVWFSLSFFLSSSSSASAQSSTSAGDAKRCGSKGKKAAVMFYSWPCNILLYRGLDIRLQPKCMPNVRCSKAEFIQGAWIHTNLFLCPRVSWSKMKPFNLRTETWLMRERGFWNASLWWSPWWAVLSFCKNLQRYQLTCISLFVLICK